MDNKGILFGCAVPSNKDGVIFFDPFDIKPNKNCLIMAVSGKGMSYMVKSLVLDEISQGKVQATE